MEDIGHAEHSQGKGNGAGAPGGTSYMEGEAYHLIDGADLTEPDSS
jgi:hypothetical protein